MQSLSPHTDVYIYFEYATRMFHGEIPYRDFMVEYPPLALLIFLIPRVFAPDLASYRVAFGLEMIAFHGFMAISLACWVEKTQGPRRVPGRLAWYTTFSALLCPLALTRYDEAPTLLAFTAVTLWATGRPLRAGSLAGFGVLMKVFPGVCILPAIFRELSRLPAVRPSGTFAISIVILFCSNIWISFGGWGVQSTLDYHLERGIEVESLYSGILALLGLIYFDPPSVVFNFGAYHLTGIWASQLSALALLVQMTFVAMITLTTRFNNTTDEVRYSGAVLLAYIALGKVLSPQYLIWIVPFVVVINGPAGRYARLVFFLTCLDTTLIYPFFFDDLIGLDIKAVALLNVRNALLITLIFTMILPYKYNIYTLTGVPGQGELAGSPSAQHRWGRLAEEPDA